MCLETLGEGFSCFPGRDWEVFSKKLIVSSKAASEVLNMKFRSKVNHGFTSGCLHCAILNALYCFKVKKRPQARNMQFFLENAQNEIFET